jgi:hypothetical protein
MGSAEPEPILPAGKNHQAIDGFRRAGTHPTGYRLPAGKNHQAIDGFRRAGTHPTGYRLARITRRLMGSAEPEPILPATGYRLHLSMAVRTAKGARHAKVCFRRRIVAHARCF